MGTQESSDIKGSMSKVMKSFICIGCFNPVTSRGHTSVDNGASANLDKFCYLGHMLSVDGDADAAAEARMGWNTFRQLVPLLTNMIDCERETVHCTTIV